MHNATNIKYKLILVIEYSNKLILYEYNVNGTK